MSTLNRSIVRSMTLRSTRLCISSTSLCGKWRGIESIRYNSEYRSRKAQIANNPLYYPTLNSLPPYEQRLRVPEFIENYANIDYTQLPQKRVEKLVNLMGKIKSIRKAGKSMYFIDIVQDNKTIQIMANNTLMDLSSELFHSHHQDLKKGDFINCIGHPSKTNSGELTLKLGRPAQILSPCLNSMKLPEKLVDRKLINSNRVLNYLVNEDSRDKIIIKSMIIQEFRKFFSSRDFLEVNTPILNGPSTGANAQPFLTSSKALEIENSTEGNASNLQLRVAPELWLKRLVISGFEKIFEIGSSFRNEGIDSTHNPEFTTCEFYCSFIDLNQLMDLTQSLFSDVYHVLAKKDIACLEKILPKLVPLTETYEKYEFIPTLERITGKPLPSDLTSEALIDYTNSLGVKLPAIKSPSSLLDNLSSVFLETLSSKSYKPIFIYNQPAELSPLSKSTEISYGDRKYQISLRFELFINGKEYVNAYEEENSPFEQHHKFKLQQMAKTDFNDDESLIPDWNYIESLEYGLPPTGGWGCGIDRLAMLFGGCERIEEVLTFGTLKDVLKN